MKNFKKVAVIAAIIFSTAFAMEKSPQPQIWQGPQPTFVGMPKEIQALIVTQIKENIVTDNLDKTLKNITNFALINKDFRNFLNHPQNIKWLVTTIARRGTDRWIDIDFVANRLHMPGMQHPEIQKWVNGFKLVRAAQYNNLQEVERLLKEGADVNAILIGASGAQETALIEAASRENLEIAQVLLRAGADVNALNGRAFRIAATGDDIEMVQEFLKYNPDLSLRAPNGKTVLDAVIANGREEIADLIRQKEAEYKAQGK